MLNLLKVISSCVCNVCHRNIPFDTQYAQKCKEFVVYGSESGQARHVICLKKKGDCQQRTSYLLVPCVSFTSDKWKLNLLERKDEGAPGHCTCAGRTTWSSSNVMGFSPQ